MIGRTVKTIFLTAILTLSIPVMADSADELLSAQAAFRQALQQQTQSNNTIVDLQNRLQNAEVRRQKAEAEINSLKSELQTATQQKAQQDSVLEAAGARLNAAWEAARQAGIRQ